MYWTKKHSYTQFMKPIQRTIDVLALAAVIFAFSCSKAGSVYDGTAWYGKTGTMSSITLSFSDGAQKCIVIENAGWDGIGFEFQVEWKSRYSFQLQFTEGEQTLIFYSGVISGDIMTLETENHTYELRKTH